MAVYPPKPVYIVWQLDSGEWAARTKPAYPFKASEHSVGKTPTQAIRGWEKKLKKSFQWIPEPVPSFRNRSTGGVIAVPRPGILNQVHFALKTAKSSVCGKPRGTLFWTDQGEEVSCDLCQRKVGVTWRNRGEAQVRFRQYAQSVYNS